MKYNYLLFDADDTFLDFKRSEKLAFFETMKLLEIEADEQFFLDYKVINRELWKQLEQGKLEKDEVSKQRFPEFFASKGINLKNSVDGGKLYNEVLSKQAHVVEGAQQVLEKLSKVASLCIVTNGIASIQTPRLDKCDLKKYFKHTFISEKVGYNKPDKQFFDAVFAVIGEQNRESSIIIGDSLTSDMQGAKNAGIDSCFYNPHGIENEQGIPVTYEIKKLEQLFEIFEV